MGELLHGKVIAQSPWLQNYGVCPEQSYAPWIDPYLNFLRSSGA